MAARRLAGRGFTLVELVVVIGVIALLAALLLPTVLNQDERAREAAEKHSIAILAEAFQRFRNDTGFWPYEAGYWDTTQQLDPAPFNLNDTALIAPPPGPAPGSTQDEPQCSSWNIGLRCWGGPYLGKVATYTTLQDQTPPVFIDAWDRPRMYALIRPDDGLGGGTSGAPCGFVVVWSTGPDGLDQTGCTTGACVRNLDAVSLGLPSCGVQGCADDIIQVAGPAKKPCR